ncbi:hypothetical protein O9X81_00225 [Agrobacterium salinitolerans]|uniref:hypothetical protein n=1 Tax=Agrobacterium salinitolerans TaxID=1183413 RepID=UPI0022B82375|nr:hypothetical protein [Agrobacterium salinitolerans]MCZ7855034.1 hypothetical protein [Agrobacterium salinitolerans]
MRHASLADQLAALRRFVTEPDHEPEPLQTNWSIVPANDNNADEIEDLKHDRKRLVTPSVAEIMKNVATGEVERNEAGQVIRIGKLRFSDGTQTEKAYRLTIDGGVEEYAARMPAGAMLGSRDKVDVALGGDDNPQEVTDSNQYFADMLNTKKARYLTGKKHKGPRVRMTADEARAELAKAYANTDMSKVTFTRCPDGLPCGSAKIADSFLGMQKTTCAGGGSMMWQDIVTATAERKEWFDAVDQLKEKDRLALNASRFAENYADVGVALGQTRTYADKKNGGRKALMAANDNLMSAIRKFSA